MAETIGPIQSIGCVVVGRGIVRHLLLMSAQIRKYRDEKILKFGQLKRIDCAQCQNGSELADILGEHLIHSGSFSVGLIGSEPDLF